MEKSREKTVWPCWRGLLPGGIVFFLIYGFVFLRGGHVSDWENVFVPAALQLQAGEPIHHAGKYIYPPAMAMLSMPLANLSPSVSLLCWYSVNVAASLIVFVCAWRLSGGPSLRNLQGHWLIVMAMGMVLAGRFFVAPLENRQFDMVIAALLLTGCYLLWRGSDIAGAAWLGASAAMKCTPLLFVPYLLWRGKPKAALILAAMAIMLNVLPDLFWPQKGGGSYLADWYGLILQDLIKVAPGEWYTDVRLNQSLSGLFYRFLVLGPPLSLQQWGSEVVARHSSELVSLERFLVYATGLVLLALTAWRYGRPGIPAPAGETSWRHPVPLKKLQTGMECAGIVCLMLLVSPMSSKSHYVVLLLPSLILARLGMEQRSRWVALILGALLLTGPLTAKGFVGKAFGDLTLAWGLPTFFALVSLIGIWLAIGATQRFPRTAAPDLPRSRSN